MELVSSEEYNKIISNPPPIFIKIADDPREAQQGYRKVFTKFYNNTIEDVLDISRE